MRKSSLGRRSSMNPVRVSTFEREDKSGGRSDARRTQVSKSKAQLQVDNSHIPRPRIRSSSSDRTSIRRSNLKAPGKTPLGQQQIPTVRVSTATTPLHSQITPRVSTNRQELPTGNRHRSPSAERASGFGGKGPRKDTRPLTDKAYQTSMLNKIDKFFENIKQSAMLNPSGSLRPITLKIFVEVTGCLVTVLEVKHQPTIGNYMEEIPKIAKKLHYPGIVTKSWLKTANTMHSWPQVLGWLSWLVEVCEAKDLAAESFQMENLPFIENNEDEDTNKSNFLAIMKFYGAWNEWKLDKETAMIEEHVQKINNQHGDVDKLIEEQKLALENEQARNEIVDQQAAAIDEQVNSLRELLETLKKDECEEIDRAGSIENSIQKIGSEIEHINSEIGVLQDDIKKDAVRQTELRVVIEKQPMSIQERDAIMQKCSEIQEGIHHFDNHVKEIEKELFSMDIKFAAANRRLYKAILAYNKDIIMHLGGDKGTDLDELKMPETNMLSPDFLDLMREKEAAMLNLKENTRKELSQTTSEIEKYSNELDSLTDKLKILREQNKHHVDKMHEQKTCIQKLQRRTKETETKLKEQIKILHSDIAQLQESMPDLESVANQLAEARDKYEAVMRRNQFSEKKAERFFDKFYQIIAHHRNELANIFQKVA